MIAKHTGSREITISSAVDRDQLKIIGVAAAARCVTDPTSPDVLPFHDADNARAALRTVFVRRTFAFVVVIEAARAMT